MKHSGGFNSINFVVFWLLWLAVLVRTSSSSSSQLNFLGVSPEDYGYYRSSDVLKCKDGSKKFTKSQLNDDFCDCPDGTDEPGTSACPGGKFYCTNAGHVSLFLFSSRVNDGICDCCDGSDEYDGKVKCENTCWEAGKVAREKLKKKIATYEEGVAIRKLEVEQAKLAISKDEAELTKLKSEEQILKGLVQKLREHKERIEKAEEKERQQKEKEEKEKKEAQDKASEKTSETQEEEKEKKEAQDKASEKTSETQEEVVEERDEASDDYENGHEPTETAYEKSGISDDSSLDQDWGEDPVDLVGEDESKHSARAEPSLLSKKEHDTAKEEDKSHAESETVLHSEVKDSIGEVRNEDDDTSRNMEELSREELGRLVASRWTGENKKTEEVVTSKDNYNEGSDEIQADGLDDEYDGDASETDEDMHKYDDDVEDEIEEDLKDENHDDDTNTYKYESDTEADSSESTSKPTWLEKIQQTVRDVLQAVNIFQTPLNQSDADHVRKEYDESSAKLSKIQSRISSLTQKLKHDFGPEKEFYSLYDRCLESKQNKYVYKVCPYKRASQVEGHSTTRLGQWEKFEESYKAMIFSGGDKCWNGPDRSLKVKLKCGLKNEIADVDEPSRCEYLALFSTPILCLEEKLQELKNKLQLMNEKQPSNHDEL